MQTLLIVLSTSLTLLSVVPYLIDIWRGKTKPNLVSWITWTLLTTIATVAALSAGEVVTAILTGFSALETGLVVAFGLIKRAYVRYERFDVICQVAALVGVALWFLFDSPLIAIIASVTIDFIGGLPTLRHAWRRPNEETWQTYGLSAVANILAIVALESYTVISMLYILYLAIANSAFAAVIIYRKRYREA